MSLWAELSRRNVVKVAIAYLIVAWIIAQIASVFAPALNLPDWALSFVTFLLILGFPIALFLAWAYELTPDGIRQTREEPSAAGPSPRATPSLNYAIMGLLVLAILYLVVDDYLPAEVDETIAAADGASEMLGPTALHQPGLHVARA